jgi:hypothetical protein
MEMEWVKLVKALASGSGSASESWGKLWWAYRPS